MNRLFCRLNGHRRVFSLAWTNSICFSALSYLLFFDILRRKHSINGEFRRKLCANNQIETAIHAICNRVRPCARCVKIGINLTLSLPKKSSQTNSCSCILHCFHRALIFRALVPVARFLEPDFRSGLGFRFRAVGESKARRGFVVAMAVLQGQSFWNASMDCSRRKLFFWAH